MCKFVPCENSMMAQRLKQLLSMVLLVIGGLIYLLFRPYTLLMFHVTAFLGLTPSIHEMRTWVADWQLGDFIIYSLPNGLWSMAYILFSDSILFWKPVSVRLFVGGIIPLMGIGSEMLQDWGIIPGTFDVMDIICYGFLYILYMLLLTRSNQP